MNIEIDYEVAAILANNVMMQDYKHLLEGGFYSGSDESLSKLLDAYWTVMLYCTTEDERKANNLSLQLLQDGAHG